MTCQIGLREDLTAVTVKYSEKTTREEQIEGVDQTIEVLKNNAQLRYVWYIERATKLEFPYTVLFKFAMMALLLQKRKGSIVITTHRKGSLILNQALEFLKRYKIHPPVFSTDEEAETWIRDDINEKRATA